MVAAATLGACDFVSNAVTPSVTGGSAGSATQPTAITPLDASKLGQPSATSAGQRVPQFQANLTQLQQVATDQLQRQTQLQSKMDASVADYQIAMGTLKPDQKAAPVSGQAVSVWQHAQAQLQTISATLDQMSGLSNEVAKNVAYAAFLLQSIREADAVPDANAEDHRQLGVLQASADQTSRSLDQALTALREEVLHQSHFLGSEGAKLAQMAPPGAAAGGVATGMALPPLQSAAPSTYVAGPAGAGLASGRPFVIIRFENPGVEYEQQLYQAVSAALARAPEVAFDLVGVAPETGADAENSEAVRGSLEKVRASLVKMGLPPDRVSISQMTDPDIQGNEVRLYVR